MCTYQYIWLNCLLICFNLEDQPGPPTNVVALPHSSSSIIISWSPPLGNYSIRAYTVHYQKLGKVNNKEVQDVIDKDTHSWIVPRLSAFTNYSLYVKAYTKVIGKTSEVIVQRTHQDSKSISFLITLNISISTCLSHLSDQRIFCNFREMSQHHKLQCNIVLHNLDLLYSGSYR